MKICHAFVFFSSNRLLLEAGSRPDEIDSAGQTPLLVACQADHVRVIRLLLRPVLALEDDQSNVSIDQSVQQLIDDLLPADVSRDLESEHEYFAGHDYLAKTALQTINQAALDGRSPLRAAALNNNANLVRALLALGADPDQQVYINNLISVWQYHFSISFIFTNI